MSQHERPFIPIAAPVLSARELELITEAVTTHWVSSAGPFLRDFETQFAAAIGIARAEAVSSGTAALQVVLHAIGIGPGDEVIVPSQTFDILLVDLRGEEVQLPFAGVPASAGAPGDRLKAGLQPGTPTVLRSRILRPL